LLVTVRNDNSTINSQVLYMSKC